MDSIPKQGAWIEHDAVYFRIWAPDHERVEIVLYAADGRQVLRVLPTNRTEGGFFEASEPGLRAGALYKVEIDGEGPYPDPYARALPFGVHGPSALVDPSHPWTDRGFGGIALEELVVYEVHVGTATHEGTFEALIERLADIRALGATAIELMPIASFPGRRGWGYDGVGLFAPHAPYGGPGGLRRLVDAAHEIGLGVIVDCVYNHLGPSGNYLRAYSSRYFTERHETPWGPALNFDDEGAGPVRAMFLANAEMWIRDYHVDGLRLDATHQLHDASPTHVLQEIAERARAAGGGRRVVVVAEDENNDARLVTPVAEGGLGLDAVWADDFHHQLRVAFAGDRDGYFADFGGTTAEIARTLRSGWFYEGQMSKHRGGPRGTPAAGLSPMRFVHCIQNHDQVGNRALGDRLGAAVSPAAFRAMTALVLLGPYTPLLFMGQEWNARTPFQFFTDHDPELGRLVTEGRRREFASFAAFTHAEVPDPQDPATFERSKLDWSERLLPEHAGVLAWYVELLRLRREHPAMRSHRRADWSVEALGADAVRLERRGAGGAVALVVALRGEVAADPDGAWRVLAHSEEPRFGGATQGTPRAGPAAVILER